MKFSPSLLVFSRSAGLHLIAISPHTFSSSGCLAVISVPWVRVTSCLSPLVLLQLFQVNALQQDQAELFLLFICRISVAADADVLRGCCISVSWAWQHFEMHSLWKEGEKELVIWSLLSEGKPVPSTGAPQLLCVALWLLPFNKMSPFVFTKSDSNQLVRMWGHAPAMRKDCYLLIGCTSECTIFFSISAVP